MTTPYEDMEGAYLVHRVKDLVQTETWDDSNSGQSLAAISLYYTLYNCMVLPMFDYCANVSSGKVLALAAN